MLSLNLVQKLSRNFVDRSRAQGDHGPCVPGGLAGSGGDGVKVRAANKPFAKFSQSWRRPILGPFLG